MHILYTAPAYKPAYRAGGPVRVLSALAEGLVRKGHRVTVFATNSNLDEDLDVPVDKPVEVDGVEVYYFRRVEYVKRILWFVPYLSQSSGYLYAPAMARELTQIVPSVDVVHTHLPFIYPTLAGARAARRFRKPLFYHQHGVLGSEHLKFRGFKKKLYIRLIERGIMENATTLIALTRADEESYRALGLRNPCAIIPNGVNAEEFAASPTADVERDLGIARDSSVVLFMGRLHATKGVDRLIRAYAEVSRRLSDVCLVIAGPDECGLEAALREEARKAGVADRVIFAGMVSGTPKVELLARADIFCLPSDAEGFSIAVLEALASGTPVLISPGCHFDEVQTAGAGRVVEPKPDLLAAALADMLSLPRAKLRDMGRAGRELVSREYSWDRVTELLVEAYQEGIQRSQV